MKHSSKKIFKIDENAEIFREKFIPPLKICASPRAIESNCESSLSYRIKKRNQVHKSLDFNLTGRLILSPKVIKADHSIVTQVTQKAMTSRRANFGTTITVNNRMAEFRKSDVSTTDCSSEKEEEKPSDIIQSFEQNNYSYLFQELNEHQIYQYSILKGNLEKIYEVLQAEIEPVCIRDQTWTKPKLMALNNISKSSMCRRRISQINSK